jgi:hypothetical protein
MRNTAQETANRLARADAEVESIFGQINAAKANGFEDDPESPAYTRGSETEFWYRTARARLVLRGLDGADLHVFDGPISFRLTALAFTVRFDGNIPAEALEAAIRGAM